LKAIAKMEAKNNYVIHEKIVCTTSTFLGPRPETSNVVG